MERGLGPMRWSGALVAVMLAGAMLPAGYAGEKVKTITISTQEFIFSPNKLTVHVGQPVRLVFSNRGTVNHEFVSPILNAAKDVDVSSQGVTVEGDEIGEVNFARGKVAALEMTPTKVGTFQFWCAQTTAGKSHRDLGMRGTIAVVK